MEMLLFSNLTQGRHKHTPVLPKRVIQADTKTVIRK